MLNDRHFRRPQVCQSFLELDSLRLNLQEDGTEPDWAVVWTAALTDALQPRLEAGRGPSGVQASLQACLSKYCTVGQLSLYLAYLLF